jgi:hypothetical protein
MTLLANDQCVYFLRSVSPEPIDWHRNPFDGTGADRRRPWYELHDYRAEQGDPRMLWEPSRAAWAIDCAKAYAQGLDAESVALFWRWTDSWMNASPPFFGWQWKCGQESAIRLLAIMLAFWAMARDKSTDSERFVQMARLAWATGYRIAHHIQYAISQKNNHAISEACGLMLIGQLFPELRQAQAWYARGRHVLIREIGRQVYEDGSYVQHSMNYQRVMLQMSLVALRLAELAEDPLPPDIYKLLAAAGNFLYQMMDPDTGQLPAYGHNDGAYVLPLSECDFQDFRPVIQATHYVTRHERLLDAGPWDEDLLWLSGPEALSSPVAASGRPESRAFPAGGYYTLRRPNSWAMLRCHWYRDRPGQCDQLHVDLWWRGQNMLRDCGTYRYYCPQRPDIEYYFKSVRAHNTVEMDGTNPSELVSRFLWFPWPRGKVVRFDPGDDSWGAIEAVSHDYHRAPIRCRHHRTLIALPNDLWVVVDDFDGTGHHTAVARWHLPDVAYRLDLGERTLTLDTQHGPFAVAASGNPVGSSDRFEVIRGRDQPDQVQGFAAPYYGQRLPIPTLEVTWCGWWPQRVVWAFCPRRPVIPRLDATDSGAEHWRLDGDAGCYQLALAPLGAHVEKRLLGVTTSVPQGQRALAPRAKPTVPR